MRTDLSPRFLSAIDSGLPLFQAGELWLSVLNKQVDSQADFQACASSSNIDFTTDPGYARLTINTADSTIDQTTDNTDLSFFYPDYGAYYVVKTVFQKFNLELDRRLFAVTLEFDATGAGGACDCYCYIVRNLQHWSGSDGWQGQDYELVHSWYISIANGFSGTKRTEFATLPFLQSGDYWIWVIPRYNRTFDIRYQNTDVYPGGGIETKQYYWLGPRTYNEGLGEPTGPKYNGYASVTGDLYFSIELAAFSSSGSYVSQVLDLGKAPDDDGAFQSSLGLPNGSACRLDLSGSDSADMSGGILYEDIKDGAVIAPYRFWQLSAAFRANADRGETPSLDMFEVLFADRKVRFRQHNAALRYADPDFIESYRPILQPAAPSGTELKPIERIGNVGSCSLTLETGEREIIQEIVSGGPLKNYRCALYYGADVPGFRESDLARFFLGIVDNAEVMPLYRNRTASLTLPLKNPVLELKQKAPLATSAGSVDLGDISIDYDGIHVLDVILGIMRAHGRVPARYINLDSFTGAKPSLGYGGLGSGSLVVYRSDAAGLADTRIKNPEEITKLIAPLLLIADGYLVVDGSGRLAFVRHQVTGTPDAVWADEDLVREGLDAVPMETAGKILLGYGDLLFNLAYMGHTWNGTGDGWETFGGVMSAVNADSAYAFGQGENSYLSLADKLTKDASKWLGPEAGYNGAAIAAALAQTIVDRYGYPPVRMTGVVVPLSQFKLDVGSIVKVYSREFCRYPARRGIALSESILFMVTQAKYDPGKVRMVMDLIEMT